MPGNTIAPTNGYRNTKFRITPVRIDWASKQPKPPDSAKLPIIIPQDNVCRSPVE